MEMLPPEPWRALSLLPSSRVERDYKKNPSLSSGCPVIIVVAAFTTAIGIQDFTLRGFHLVNVPLADTPLPSLGLV
jgi:hypothetical protein